MFGDKYRDLLSSVARLPEGEGGVAEANAGESPPAAGGDPPAPSGDKVEAKGAAPQDGDKKDDAKPPKGRSTETVFQDRIGELTRHRREAERQRDAERVERERLAAELRAAQELLQARGKGEAEGEAKPTPARPAAQAPAASEFLSTPEGKAAVAAQAAAEARAAEISRRGDEIYDNAEKEFGKAKLDKVLGNFKAFDGLRVDLAEAIFDVDEPHKVLFEIGNNPDTIDRLYKLAETNPVKMAVEVAKIATRVAAKPGPKKVSDAPEPPDIINGRGNSGPPDLADKDLPMDKWIEARNKDLQKRGVRL